MQITSEIITRLNERIKKEKLSYSHLSEEMQEDGMKMDGKRMSRFFRTGNRKWMPEKSLLWLMARVGIEYEVVISETDFDDKKCREDARRVSQQ